MFRKLMFGLLLAAGLAAGAPGPAQAGAVQLFSNNAVTLLASPAGPSATSLTVTSSALFPAPTSGSWFIATLEHLVSGVVTADEIVKVTAVSGTTWTVVRAQEGTSALTWSAGDTIALLPTAGGLAQFVQPSQAQTQSYNYAADTGSANAYVVALTPALTAHVTGMPINFRVANTNTGSSTFNDGAGTSPILLPSQVGLTGSELLANNIATVVWHGSHFILTSGNYDTVPAVDAGLATTLTSAESFATSAANAAQATAESYTDSSVAPLAPLASPGFTGNPTAPSPAFNDNSTKVATTAYANALLLNSPALGGTPTAATAGPGTSTTQLASTAFVQAALAATLSGTVGTNGSVNFAVSGATNGMILKWGFHTPGTAFSGIALEAISFPVAFPHHCYFAAAFTNRTTSSLSGIGAVSQASLSTSGFSAIIDQDASGHLSALWFAIGD